MTAPAPPSLPRRSLWRSRGFQLTVGLLVSAICLWWALSELRSDPDAVPQMMAAFRQANYSTLPVFLVVLFTFYWLKAWRWRLLLAPVGRFRPLRDLFGPIMIGFALNNSLPARIGELTRCFTLSRQQQVPLVAALSSVVLERVLDGIAIVTYLAIGLSFIEGLDPTYQRTAYGVAAVGGLMVAGGLVYVLWTKPFVAIVEAVLHRAPFLPRSLTAKVCRLLEAGAQGLASLRDIRLVLGIVVLSFVKWGLNAVLFLLALRSFGVDVSPLVAMVLMGVVAFAVAVPTAPGYFGVIQLCFTKVLALFQVNQQTAFAASIYYHLAQWIPVTAVGLIYLALSGLRVSQAAALAEQRAQTDAAVELR